MSITTNCDSFYINGRWQAPHSAASLPVINPSTGEASGLVAMGDESDVDSAVLAARAAFAEFSMSTRDERIALLERVLAVYESRLDDVAQAITLEMGAPRAIAKRAQAAMGTGHLKAALAALRELP